MTNRLHYSDLERLLADPSAPDEVLATYLKAIPGRSGPLVPEIVADEGMVDVPRSRGIIGLSIKALNDRAHRQRAEAYRKRIDGGWSGLRLLAEGDSWFQYPVLLRDVVDNLSAHYAVYSEASAGDTLANMLGGLTQLESLIREHRFDGLLLSAGGNDIAGKALLDHLLPHTEERPNPESYLGNRFSNFLADTRRSYDEFFRRLTTAFPELHIFCHGYDWPYPRANGSWLAPALMERQIPATVQFDILHLMIDRYYDALKATADRYAGRVHVVDCRSAVGDIGEWFDELHPRNSGFVRVSERFSRAIDKAFGITPSTRGGKLARITWYSRAQNGAPERMERIVPIGGELTIGRSPDRDIRLVDPHVSRNHARLEIGRVDAEIEDLGSSNGSRIDGKRVTKARWRPGQTVGIGSFTMELEFVEAATPDRAMPAIAGALSSGAAAMSPPQVPEAPLPIADVGGKRPIEIEICSGNITNVASPAYAIGVFQHVNPVARRGSAYEIDQSVDGLLSSMVQGGVFNSQLGEVSLLPASRHRSLAQLILVAGLGAINRFAPPAIEVVGENLARMLVTTRIAELATVPIGAAAGVSIKDFVVRFLTGFLRGLGEADGARTVRKLSIVEIGEERHAALLGETRGLDSEHFFDGLGFEATVTSQDVGGREKRAAAGAASTLPVSPVYLQVASPKPGAYDYFILAAELGAAIQSHSQTVDPVELQRVASLTTASRRFDAELGKVLVETFVPEPMQQLIERSLTKPNAHLVVIHDHASSGIPWEALYINGRCPALDKGLSRLYRVAARSRSAGRQMLPRSSRLRLLMIENPTGDLAGAATEGQRLSQLFKDHNGDVTVLSGKAATREAVQSELATGHYEILHYAGHADFSPDRPGEGGLILSDGHLTAAHMHDVGKVPQLIFLNACESGRLRGPADEASRDAALSVVPQNVGIAESFLLHGVANFIGTFWKVDDAAANGFAATFYGGLLTGKAMSVAMREARHGIHSVGPRDWANYLHFGDPLYVLRQA